MELCIFLRVTSRTSIGPTATRHNIGTVCTLVLRCITTEAIFLIILNECHSANLVKIAVSWSKLVHYYATYNGLKVRILEDI